jgi:hypothetical protein
MNSKYIIDPNGRYDSVVGSVIRYGIGLPLLGVLLWVALSMCGCKTVKPIAQTRDSICVEIRHDSVFVFKHDSIFRDRWRSGDTVFVTVEKFKTLYRDKLVEVHDTIATTHTDTIEVQVVPNYYRRVSTGFWILLVILLAITAFKAYKLYLRIQSGGIL